MNTQEEQAIQHAKDNYHDYAYVIEEAVTNYSISHVTSGYDLMEAIEDLGLIDVIDNLTVTFEQKV